MNNDTFRSQLLNLTALASQFCNALESAAQMEKDDFISEMVLTLPRLYYEFADTSPDDAAGSIEYEFLPTYVDEDYYESIRRSVENLLADDDTFLETFEEDMKYSDTPIAASISESLADIFQPLYNFVSVVRESQGEQGEDAFRACREAFEEYWAQTLCNVMRPLNHLHFNK